MNEITVKVRPVFEVIEDADFKEGWAKDLEYSKDISVSYCFECGSPLMYVKQEFHEEDGQRFVDVTTFCAVCGQGQGGWDVYLGESDVEQEEKAK